MSTYAFVKWRQRRSVLWRSSAARFRRRRFFHHRAFFYRAVGALPCSRSWCLGVDIVSSIIADRSAPSQSQRAPGQPPPLAPKAPAPKAKGRNFIWNIARLLLAVNFCLTVNVFGPADDRNQQDRWTQAAALFVGTEGVAAVNDVPCWRVMKAKVEAAMATHERDEKAALWDSGTVEEMTNLKQMVAELVEVPLCSVSAFSRSPLWRLFLNYGLGVFQLRNTVAEMRSSAAVAANQKVRLLAALLPALSLPLAA